MGASCEVSGRLLSFKLFQSTTILVFNEDFWWLASSEFNICVVHIMLFKGHFSSCLIVKCVVVLKALIKFLGQKKKQTTKYWSGKTVSIHEFLHLLRNQRIPSIMDTEILHYFSAYFYSSCRKNM